MTRTDIARRVSKFRNSGWYESQRWIPEKSDDWIDKRLFNVIDWLCRDHEWFNDTVKYSFCCLICGELKSDNE